MNTNPHPCHYARWLPDATSRVQTVHRPRQYVRRSAGPWLPQTIRRVINRLIRPALQCAVLLPLMASSHAVAATVGVVVGGLGGNAGYAERFAEESGLIADALSSLQQDDGDIVLLASDASREAILEAIDAQAQRDADTFVLVLVGHGSTDAQTWKFNLAGPDLTTEDLVAALAGVQAPEQLLVIASSASGALLKTLGQPGRVVITATKSGGEINAVRFPTFFAAAMESSVADIDRNEILTAAEAFRFAAAATADYYETRKLLASEHARLDGDNAADLAIARLGSLRNAAEDPAVAGLLMERLSLEDAFKALKRRKSELQPTDYYAELEALLIRIARLQSSIDAATGWSDSDAES